MGLFSGSKPAKQTTRITRTKPAFPLNRTSSGSSIDTTGTAFRPVTDISLNPQIEQLRQESLAGTRDLTGQVRSDISTLRELQNPFIQARVRPLQERLRQSRSALDQNFGRRNVFGSFRQNALNNFDIQSGQAISDQTALATREVQDSILQRQGFQRNLSNDISRQQSNLLNEELQQLNLSQNSIAQVIQSQFQDSTSTSGRAEKKDNTLESLGTIASVAALFFS